MQPRDLSDHAPYRAGRGPDEVARERGLDPGALVVLSSNENPFGPSPDAVATIRDWADRAHRYPKASHADLTTAIADRHGVDDAQVWLANGGDGALDYLARAMLAPGDPVFVPDPGFAYYGMSARFHHGTVREYAIERERDFALDAETVLDAYAGERIVYLTSPNNPTGGRFSLAAIEEIADRTADQTLVVVDEAYVEYATATSAVSLVRDGGARDDIAVLRTFSKAFGLAGCRLGYAIVSPDWAGAYERVTTPFAAGELACRAGLAALGDDEHIERVVTEAAWARDYYREQLTASTWESHANFVLADVGDAAEVTDRLADRGVLVRDCTSFGLPACIRITCGTREETRVATDAIDDVLREVDSAD